MKKAVALCYNLKGSARGTQLGMIFGFLGFEIRHVEKTDYMRPIGELAGILPSNAVAVPYTGKGFPEEMLVMYCAEEDALDKVLFLMRQEKIQIPLKAMVTDVNQVWNSIALHDEIAKEHKMMNADEQSPTSSA